MRLLKTQLLHVASSGKTCCISIALWLRYHSIYQPTNFIMRTSKDWLQYFSNNLQQKRIDWSVQPSISNEALKPILKSLQAWQLGETSDGSNLINACTHYAKKINDPYYIDAMRLFIKEEQKHGNNLGLYLDLIGKPRIKKNWGDSLFRKARHINTSMQWWTLAVITVESAAQIFYQCLKDATDCKLLQQICTDILIDEAPHIRFQRERFQAIYQQKSRINQLLSMQFYKLFFYCTSMVVWLAHKKLFMAGGVNFKKYNMKMNMKYTKTIGSLNKTATAQNQADKAVLYQRPQQNFFSTLFHSFEGIRYFFRNERNGKLQLTIAAIAIVASVAFKINSMEWLAVLICVGMVICLEMVNTSLEQLSNKVETAYNPVIKLVKDVAAGAVLFASLISIAIGGIIFLPKLF
jgi:diacylglycerol kinase